MGPVERTDAMFEPEHSHVFRRTGVSLLGDKPWGTHVCLFYETAQDLLDVNARYFGAGLAEGEFCIWALSGPVSQEMAIEGLRDSIPDFEDHLRQNRIEIVPGYEWYLDGDDFYPGRIVDAWNKKHDEALARGFSGMRVSGNAFWSHKPMWPTFGEYECALHEALVGRRMMILCTYSLGESRAADMLDVACAHDVSVSIRNGKWELLETPKDEETNTPRLKNPVDFLSKPFPGSGSLTGREKIILAQLVGGVSTKQVARALEISPRTVEFHRANIMRKLGARNFTEAMSMVLGMQQSR